MTQMTESDKRMFLFAAIPSQQVHNRTIYKQAWFRLEGSPFRLYYKARPETYDVTTTPHKHTGEVLTFSPESLHEHSDISIDSMVVGENARTTHRFKTRLLSLLFLGGGNIVGDYYSFGMGKKDGLKRHYHLVQCGISLENSTTPALSEEEFFQGTFAESGKKQVLNGEISCACGEVPDLEYEADIRFLLKKRQDEYVMGDFMKLLAEQDVRLGGWQDQKCWLTSEPGTYRLPFPALLS